MSQSAARGLRAQSRLWLRELGGEPAVIVIGSCVALTLAHYHGSTNSFRSGFGDVFKDSPYAALLPYLWWFLSSAAFYLALPLTLSALTGGSFTRRYGLGLGDWRAGGKITLLFLAVMMPVVYLAAQTELFSRQYPLAGQGAYTLATKPDVTRSLAVFVIYEAAYCAYFIAWEFFYRGWMLNGLLRAWGRGPALLMQLSPFVILHFGKPEPEVLGSIVAGLALGILALRTRSFWYGAILHAAIAVWMDVLAAFPYLLGA